MSVLYKGHGNVFSHKPAHSLPVHLRGQTLCTVFPSLRFHPLSLPSSYLRAFPKQDDAAEKATPGTASFDLKSKAVNAV